MKFQVPRFDGSNPIDWLFQIKAFFEFHDTPEASRLPILSFNTEGRAAAWFQWASRNELLTSWSVFVDVVRIRFGPSLYDDVEGDLSKLTKIGFVADFQAQFEDLMNKVIGISESHLISFFITSLKRSLRRELQFHRPPTLMEAFAMAKAYEARLDDTPVSGKPWSRGLAQSPTSSAQHTIPQASSTNSPNITTPNPNSKSTTQPPLLPTPTSTLPIRHLSPADHCDRRNKGLCFKCEEKWGPSQSKILLLWGADNGDDPELDEDITTEDVAGDISSLHALSGQLQCRSLRVSGTYDSQCFQILIDRGASTTSLNQHWWSVWGSRSHHALALGHYRLWYFTSLSIILQGCSTTSPRYHFPCGFVCPCH